MKDTLKKNDPIGVFDSGIGGLSILKVAQSKLPNQTWIYVADEAFLPYGDKSSEDVRNRAQVITDFFLSKNVKAILIACNTATAAAIDFLRKKHQEMLFIGVEPAVKPAANITNTKVIGILATGSTTESNRLIKLVERFSKEIKVIIQPCPGIVELIETGDYKSYSAKKLIESYLEPMLTQKADVIALGCTHYFFLTQIIQQIVGKSVLLLDTSEPVITELQHQLSINDLISKTSTQKPEFWTTKNLNVKRHNFERAWGEPIEINYLGVKKSD
ncbi:MAG: glutamate racemase [Proteobacteria bacterium]|nr:glutamate racemase [Pseudomonadota bacterium]